MFESEKCIWLVMAFRATHIFWSKFGYLAAPEINISPMPDIVSGSRHFVPVTRNSYRSSVYDILLKFENLLVIMTGRKRILPVTHKIVPDSDRWPVAILCADRGYHPNIIVWLMLFCKWFLPDLCSGKSYQNQNMVWNTLRIHANYFKVWLLFVV